MLTCGGCGGYPGRIPGGCEVCGGEGMERFVGCPCEQIDQGVIDALMAHEQAKFGRWPAGGGWLDQTQQCLEVVRLIGVEEASLRDGREES